ncbi:beta-N-acetylhexosaminidase [Sandaracinomonas limnophila]|uniref:beta-N-acetylhexosaminidase n=2 Tax=Sandaracinomonas limnophila TaxID=1862386 RepID=A0A437PXB8_9BACT|nr:beta-N-acetylhexosaminidase [Sandaracinomonas limnophila]
MLVKANLQNHLENFIFSSNFNNYSLFNYIKMRFLILVLLFSFTCNLWAQTPAIIPIPVKSEYPTGKYLLPKSIIIAAPKDEALKTAFKTLETKLSNLGGRKIQWIQPASTATALTNIRLQINSTANAELGKEGYNILVDTKGVQIQANSAKGLFYGIQTFYQLLPKEVESASPVAIATISVPFAKITDYPRFEWRGMMFDVARHFFTKDEVKKFIDEMAQYKYNLLHWHLTDDEGWRIEIKSYPNLTKKGAFNVKKEGRFTTFSKPGKDEPRTYGGFYTQEDIKEVVQYAKERFVDIMPEVDVPGHSMAAVASYPELSCTPEAKDYQVISGEPFIDWSHGHPEALQDNTLCPANENVYVFLDKVFGEIAPLFPFEYVHIGGDECPKNYWDKNPQILELRKREGLKNSQEVQAYFMRRLSKIVTSKGKQMLGWDEILEGGGLPKSTAVMSWRGIAGGIQASNEGHAVVMTPNDNVYIDLMQGDGFIEPPVYRAVRLKDSYDFNPVPAGVKADMVKGGQANLWSEQLFNYRHAQYMTYPRSFAIAECLWSPLANKNWNDFINRTEKHFERFDVAEKKYAPSMYEPIFKFSRNSLGEIMVNLTPETEGVTFHYSFDYSYPDKFYPIANNTQVIVPKDADLMRIICIKNGKQVGRFIDVPVSGMVKRIK